MPKHKANNNTLVAPPRIIRCRGPKTPYIVALRQLLLKGVLFNFIEMCPSDKHSCDGMCLRCCKKTREEASTGQCGGRHEYNSELFRNHRSGRRRRNQQRRNQNHVRGPIVQESDLTLDNTADRALFQLFQLGTLPSELRSAILHDGPCRPKGPFAISRENGNRRIF